ncbi:Integrin alpha-3 [Nibea albiflora]|uniref:Integrin alpha-3 n=1 Tax=Nibea albiflora TaxID=240163 RepID=A0ACB7EWH2_NIBAL|nr:Integrin alpha-3 [Nibea albiflora]
MATGVCMLLSVWVGVCVALNLDTSFPLLKTGGDGSLFGLSVALHQDLKTDSYLLLVGAPREKAEPNVPANRTGGVYSCPITADQSDCSRLKLIDTDLNLSEDLIEDMWLGVSVASQGRPGGRILTEIIVGSPGSYEWQGNVHVSWMNPDVVFDIQRSSFPNMEHRNIYTGYSVTQAHCLLSQDVETIVTGAPKDSKEDARGSVLLAVKQSDKLMIQQTLRGEQMGSYFGNAVATTDLNNDGWNDLLVGAPFYFHRQQEAGGAVYVYMNKGGLFDSQPSVVLRGPAGSAFGMSVTAAGDLNQDGFQDFAVGAPFHETGSVMIWTGSSDGVSTEPSQVIQGSSISPGFRTFGYSLTGGLDVDGNKYPDLLVGSLDNTVALLRARPVIHLNKTLRVSPDIIDPNSCDSCIQVEVCFSYIFSTGATSDRDDITIHFTVSADVTSFKSRLRFHDNGQSMYSGYLTTPKRRCQTLKVGLLSPVRDKVEPLVFSLNVSLYEKLPKKRNTVQDLKHFPVLNQPPRPIRTQIHIQKACGSDNRCHSNLQMTARFTDENQMPLPMQKDRQVLYYNDSINRLFLEVNVSNTPSPDQPAEDAHNAVLNISIPPLLIYSGVRAKGDVQSVVECSAEDDVLLCELGNPFKSNQKVQLSVLVNPPGPVSFSGHVIGELSMKKTEDIGSLLLFTLQVHIKGKPLGRLGNLQVEFDWPREVSNGKWLLYLTEIQINGTSEPLCSPPGNIINPLNLKLSNEEKKRRRSLQEEEAQKEDTQPVLHLQGQKKKSYTLDCVGGANCVTFVCPLVNMKNSATLTIRARLWNSTMIEDYSNAWSVLVRGRATLKLQTDKSTINMESHSTEIEVHIYPDVGQQLDSSTPLWIIMVSVLAGLVLLALICLLLWKCGFFRRASTRELYQAKTQKAHMKSQRLDLKL